MEAIGEMYHPNTLPGFQSEFSDRPLIRKWINRDSVYMSIVLLALIVIGSVDSVLYVRIAHKMENYEWFLSQIVISFCFMLISWPIVVYKRFVSKTISKSSRQVSAKIFIFVALFDGVADLLGTLPAPYISGPVMTVIAQMNIPFLMCFSYIFLKARYKWNHFLGVFVIVTGVLVSSISLVTGEPLATKENTLIWVCMLCLGLIPATVSNIWKENSLKNDAKGTMDVWYFNAKVASFQFIWGILMFWVIYVPLPEPSPHEEFKDTPQYISNSVMCFFGQRGEEEPQCDNVWIVFCVYIMFNVGVNVLALYVYKIASALVAIIVGTAALVLVNLLYHVKFIAGEALATEFSVFNIIALVAILFGIVVFRAKEEKRKGEADTLGLVYSTGSLHEVSIVNRSHSSPSSSGTDESEGNDNSSGEENMQHGKDLTPGKGHREYSKLVGKDIERGAEHQGDIEMMPMERTRSQTKKTSEGKKRIARPTTAKKGIYTIGDSSSEEGDHSTSVLLHTSIKEEEEGREDEDEDEEGEERKQRRDAKNNRKKSVTWRPTLTDIPRPKYVTLKEITPKSASTTIPSEGNSGVNRLTATTESMRTKVGGFINRLAAVSTIPSDPDDTQDYVEIDLLSSQKLE